MGPRRDLTFLSCRAGYVVPLLTVVAGLWSCTEWRLVDPADSGLDAEDVGSDAGGDADGDGDIDADGDTDGDIDGDIDGDADADQDLDAPPDGDVDAETPCVEGAFECVTAESARRCLGGSWSEVFGCPLGCEGPTAECRIPSNVPKEDLDAIPADVEDLLVPADGDVVIDTDTGLITSGGATVRAAGEGMDAGSGIYFVTAAQAGGSPELGIFGVAHFDVAAGSVVTVVGGGSLVVVARQAAVIAGTINAVGQVETPGSGGFAGGVPDVSGNGSCPGLPGEGMDHSHYCDSGGGGGGHGGGGGSGGDSGASGDCVAPNDFVGGAGGAGGCGAPELVPLAGGSGGAGGTSAGAATNSEPGRGGGGGGAIQISSALSVEVASTGGINVGGGPGDGCSMAGGAGGGAGGAILIEAPEVTVADGAILAANGGGGGGGDCD